MHSTFRISAIAALATLGMVAGNSAQIEEHAPNPKEIRVIPVDPTPEPTHCKLKVLFPREGEMRNSSPITGSIRVEGFPLGVDSDFQRKKEVYNDSEGQALHIFIDNHPYFAVNEALLDSLDDVEEYFDQDAQFEVPFRLQPGMHVMRVIAVRSFNESLKGDNCSSAITFYYQDKTDNIHVDLSAPYLTYNEPQGDYTMRNDQPILLDFYLNNVQLSRDGYKVRLTIDNSVQRTLTSWQPYYIYGLKRGSHKIRLELLDRQNKVVNGIFNDVQRTISIR